LEEPALLNEASAAASLLTDARIARAPVDVFGGLAGEILGLIALHAATADPVVLERAVACGRSLVSRRTARDGGAPGWATFADRLLTGFSHGAAGIAYALLRLHAATDDLEYRAAAIDAIAYEDRLFEPELENWPDLREDAQPAYKANWCHGAPGIGLARLGALPTLDTEQVRQDIEAALRTTLLTNLDGPDHLCCGNLGRVDVLLVAGERLGRPDLSAAGRERAQQVARRGEAMGGFSLHPPLPQQIYMPGFFMGTAGIGYELLRSTHPDVLPSALLWE
jgi:lantibiotic modifying enzyme